MERAGLDDEAFEGEFAGQTAGFEVEIGSTEKTIEAKEGGSGEAADLVEETGEEVGSDTERGSDVVARATLVEEPAGREETTELPT